MTRAKRLLALLASLQRRRAPVPASALAAEFDVSERTIYRDLAALARQGAPLKGAPGLGYVLRPGLFLPPLMLNGAEADAVMLGLRFVTSRGDPALAAAASAASAKVAAVLPAALEARARLNGLMVARRARPAPEVVGLIREALRSECELRLAYGNETAAKTERTVWPVALGFFEDAEVLAAWCELRKAFRHFRLEWIETVASVGDRMPKPHRTLLAEWRKAEGVMEL